MAGLPVTLRSWHFEEKATVPSAVARSKRRPAAGGQWRAVFGPQDRYRVCRNRCAEQEGLSVAEKRLTGRIAAEHIKLMAVPRPPQGTVERFKALGDPTGIISDTMDELGIPSGVIGAS